MPHRVAERGLLPPEDLLRQDVIVGKRLTDQVFAHVMAVHFQRRVNGHGVAHKGQIAEGHPGLQRVDGDASIRPQHVVHVQLPDALFRLMLERGRVRREIGVLVAEQLVGNFAGQQHPNVRVLVDVLAHQIHADAGPDSGDVIGAQQRHHRLQRFQYVLFGDDDFRVVAADEIRHLAGVFQVDGVHVHADGKGAQRLFQLAGGDGAHQRAVQPAAEQEAQRRVRIQPFFHACGQQIVQAPADGIFLRHQVLIHPGRVGVADERAARPVAARREGQDRLAQAHQHLGLAGKNHGAVCQRAVIQRADADGIPGGNELAGFPIVQDQGELCVQHLEHFQTIFFVQGQQNLAVGIALKCVLFFQPFFQRPETVQLAVADHAASIPFKGLHARLVQAHNGQPVEAQIAAGDLRHPGHIRPPGQGTVKMFLQRLYRDRLAFHTKNRTHKKAPPKFPAASSDDFRTNAALRGAT